MGSLPTYIKGVKSSSGSGAVNIVRLQQFLDGHITIHPVIPIRDFKNRLSTTLLELLDLLVLVLPEKLVILVLLVLLVILDLLEEQEQLDQLVLLVLLV